MDYIPHIIDIDLIGFRNLEKLGVYNIILRIS